MNKSSLVLVFVLLAPAARAEPPNPNGSCRAQTPERVSTTSHGHDTLWSLASACVTADQAVKGVSVQNSRLFGDDVWHWVDLKTFRDFGFDVKDENAWDVELPASIGGATFLGLGAEDVYFAAQAQANVRRMSAGRSTQAKDCARRADFRGQTIFHEMAVSVCLQPWEGSDVAIGVSFETDGGPWEWLFAEDLYRHGLILTQAGLVERGKLWNQAGQLKLLYFDPETVLDQDSGGWNPARSGFKTLGAVARTEAARAAAAAKIKKALAARPS